MSDDEDIEPDYEFLGSCMVPSGPLGIDGPGECRDPAIARVWWSRYEDGLLVCAWHFREITGQPI